MIDKNILRQHHEEEVHDAEAYREMAHSCPDWEQVLMDMSHEEEQHAAMIAHIMSHM